MRSAKIFVNGATKTMHGCKKCRLSQLIDIWYCEDMADKLVEWRKRDAFTCPSPTQKILVKDFVVFFPFCSFYGSNIEYGALYY